MYFPNKFGWQHFQNFKVFLDAVMSVVRNQRGEFRTAK